MQPSHRRYIAVTFRGHLKAEVRAAIGAHEKRLLKRAKQLSAGQSDRAAAAAVALAQAAAAAGQKFVVLELDGVEAKGLQPLVQKVHGERKRKYKYKYKCKYKYKYKYEYNYKYEYKCECKCKCKCTYA